MELRKEYADIVAREMDLYFDSANTTRDIAERIALACQELADRPPRELTDAEIKSACDSIDFSVLVTADDYLYVVSRAAIATHIAKQREPQVVKFRAARNKASGDLDVFRLDDRYRETAGWEWLEPAQEFEVRT